MALPPPQPLYILRGHVAQVHALEFSPSNASLLSGDAEGYVICWSLSTKRATASWRAHENAVLAVAWWTEDIVVTHGRDSKLCIWKLVSGVDTVLPVDKHTNADLRPGRTPTLCHTMIVNTLNFCAFAWTGCGSNETGHSYLLALPHTLSSEAIDIFQVKLEISISGDVSIEARRRTTIPAPELENPKTGLTMCLTFSGHSDLLAGYESGHTIAYHRLETNHLEGGNAGNLADWSYQCCYVSRPHSQPVLSVQSIPDRRIYITTSADSKLVTHQLPNTFINSGSVEEAEPCHLLDTRHSGQQGLSVRNDRLLLVTAGWDGKGRVYRCPVINQDESPGQLVPPKELAVLKWHKEGCYCTAFAHVQRTHTPGQGVVEENIKGVESSSTSSLVKQMGGQIGTSSARREFKARNTHWIGLGSKDGKISLWDIL